MADRTDVHPPNVLRCPATDGPEHLQRDQGQPLQTHNAERLRMVHDGCVHDPVRRHRHPDAVASNRRVHGVYYRLCDCVAVREDLPVYSSENNSD